MFFSQELLSKREGGYGLLWLAATLGSRSSFKKLPKRSIVVANVSQLCQLITEPSEPLALRLSSNLMVGVVRVYKVKHEMFLSDVTACFATLKRAMQDMQPTSVAGDLFLMGQPSVRPDAVTLAHHPEMAVAMQIDNLAANWDQDVVVEQGEASREEEHGNPPRARKLNPLRIEDVRGAPHTLEENYEHLLSTSLDFSQQVPLGLAASSSQIGDFGFETDPFGGDPSFDFGLGIDIARELGEDWGLPELDVQHNLYHASPHDSNAVVHQESTEPVGQYMLIEPALERDGAIQTTTPRGTKRTADESDKENVWPNSVRSRHTPALGTSNDAGVGFLWGSVVDDGVAPHIPHERVPQRKTKRLRLLLDARTELTNEELKAARDSYLDDQIRLRKDLEKKRAEKDADSILEELLWGPPAVVTAPEIAGFWKDILKAQINAQTGVLHFSYSAPPPRKRRRLDLPVGRIAFDNTKYDNVFDGQDADVLATFPDYEYRQSSEEPEQGRRASRHLPDLLPPFDIPYDEADVPTKPGSGSQRSAMLPWDNAAPTSSTVFEPGRFASVSDGGDGQVRVRRSSVSGRSRRESSLVPSQFGSLGLSPAHQGRKGSSLGDDDFQISVFQTAPDEPASYAEESQFSEANLISLERNAYNFLEYSKMKQQTLPFGTTLSFDDIVPKADSNVHVAAAAFYNCLVLASKDLFRVVQDQAYGSISLGVH